jgi:hypothetical protein
MNVTTLAEAVAHFASLGYRGDFRAEEGGLREVFTGRTFRADHLRIDELFRFEGESDPDEQVVVFALCDPEAEARGTYVVPFGPSMDRLDAVAVRSLQDGRPGRRQVERGIRPKA